MVDLALAMFHNFVTASLIVCRADLQELAVNL